MKVLVVEDESQMAEMLEAALANLGISCFLAHSADHADQLLSQHTVDAVTLDLSMPGRGGLDWLESVASSQPELARKTLVITGVELEADLIERVAHCGAGVLVKPFTLETLGEAVRTQLAHPSGERRRVD